MALQKFGYVLLNTSNKSELSNRLWTLYGDMAGGLSVLVMCTRCRYMDWLHINANKEIIPQNIIARRFCRIRSGSKGQR